MDDDTPLAGQPEAIDSTTPMNFVQMAQAWQSFKEAKRTDEQWQALLLDSLQLLACETELARMRAAITTYLTALDADPCDLNILAGRTRELREAIR